jgi:KDO2-lipid IV(A) lauroyltransferase
MSLGKAVKHGVILGLLAALRALFNLLPGTWAGKLGAGLGRLFFLLVPYERRKTLRQLAIAFPEADEAWRRKVGSGTFASLGRGAAEFFRFKKLGLQGRLKMIGEVRGFEHLTGPFDAGRGVVAVTAHVGHWELLASHTASRTRVAVVARQAYDARLDEVLTQMRRDYGVQVFARNTSVKPILKWLKEGGVLGVLCDQDTGVDSLYVPFFGHEAKTPSGAAWLAAATGAALLTAFSRRRPDGLYELEYQPEIPLPGTGRSKAELAPVVAEYTRRLEAWVRVAPEQWAWNHERWKSKKDRPSTGWDPVKDAL